MSADRIQAGSSELPDVLRTLAGVLPQFEGDGLESQLQTFDIFLGILSPSVRSQVAALLGEAAAKAQSPEIRDRIEAAAESVARGGRAAEPYDHGKAMAAYQEEFRKSNPPPQAEAQEEDKDEEDESKPAAAPRDKRSHPMLLAQLDQIEAEMKRIGYWSDNPPDLIAAAERGEIKSFLDAPTFELWLQALFIPRARKATLNDELPRHSQVGEMARRQYDYMSVVPEAETLLHLLQKFDELVELAR